MEHHVITMRGDSIAVWNHCRNFLADQRRSAEGEGTDALLSWVQMASSLYEGLLHVMLTANSHDGEVEIWPDGPPDTMSFFWKHPKSGYHGGLIFHANYKDGKRQETGKWSVHT